MDVGFISTGNGTATPGKKLGVLLALSIYRVRIKDPMITQYPEEEKKKKQNKGKARKASLTYRKKKKTNQKDFKEKKK